MIPYILFLVLLVVPLGANASLIEHGTSLFSTSKWDVMVEYWVYDPGGGSPPGSGSSGFPGSYSYWYELYNEATSQRNITSFRLSFAPNTVTGYGNSPSGGVVPSSQSVDNPGGVFLTRWTASGNGELPPGSYSNVLYLTSNMGPAMYPAEITDSEGVSATGSLPAPSPEWPSLLLTLIGLLGIIVAIRRGYLSFKEV